MENKRFLQRAKYINYSYKTISCTIEEWVSPLTLYNDSHYIILPTPVYAVVQSVMIFHSPSAEGRVLQPYLDLDIEYYRCKEFILSHLKPMAFNLRALTPFHDMLKPMASWTRGSHSCSQLRVDSIGIAHSGNSRTRHYYQKVLWTLMVVLCVLVTIFS